MFGMLDFLRANHGGGVIPVDQAAPLLARGEALFVDVREASEWACGHLPGAHHLPLSRLAHGLAALPKDRPIVVYCLSGARSARAAAVLREHGLPDVLNLHGGIAAWQRHGHPVA